ncbi:hypothetical protein ABH920_009113 [Catenulispora sp. EB89]
MRNGLRAGLLIRWSRSNPAEGTEAEPQQTRPTWGFTSPRLDYVTDSVAEQQAAFGPFFGLPIFTCEHY